MTTLGYENSMIQRAMKGKGWLAQQLATEAGITLPTAYSALKDINSVSDTTAAKIAKALGLNLDELVIEVPEAEK